MDNIFVVMQNARTNDSLFNQVPNAHDNGGFTIASIIIVVNPKPIKKFMDGMPMIESQDQAILVRSMALPSVPYCNALDAKEMK
eukprot:7190775-Ditylum_brightwellii.AAC.1